MFIEFLIYTLAAVGCICILHAIYDILFLGFLRASDCAELYLYADGRDPRAEQLLRTAARARRAYLPGMPVIFIDTGEGSDALRGLAAQMDIAYYEK